MRGIAVLLAALLLAAGCGGDDDEPSSTTSDFVTVREFIAELQPDKQKILEGFVADSSECKGVEVDPSFVLLVSAQAIDADQDAPLAELVAEQC